MEASRETEDEPVKLLYCLACGDLFIVTSEPRACLCGATRGQYVDSHSAIYSGKLAVPLGIANASFLRAMYNRLDKDTGKGERFEAFVIPKQCESFRRTDQ